MRTVVHPDYTQLSDFIRRIPQAFETEGDLLYNKRNKVKRFYANGEPLIVKRFKCPHIIQRIAYTFFKKSKAERAYLYAEVFRERGFHTPHEIAYMEQKRNGLFSYSFFITPECSDASVLQALNQNETDRPLADALAGLLVELHQKGIMHGDINLSNVLYRLEEGKYRFTLIDTNRSKFVESPTRQQCLDNLKRLTHKRELMEYVVKQYARLRGWPAEECAASVIESLTKFEAKVQRKRKFQSLLGIKKNRK